MYKYVSRAAQVPLEMPEIIFMDLPATITGKFSTTIEAPIGSFNVDFAVMVHPHASVSTVRDVRAMRA